MDLAVACCEAVCRLPAHERYGLSSQIRRSATSIPANVAEGSACRHRAEYVHHLSYARGSLAELETHLLLAERLRYLEADVVHALLGRADEVSRMLTAMMRKLA
jgi:four helix bundle protein